MCSVCGIENKMSSVNAVEHLWVTKQGGLQFVGGHKLHLHVRCENVWHFGSKECLSKICVRCHRVHHLQSSSLSVVHIYLMPPLGTLTGTGMTWMCRQCTTSCWIPTSRQTLSQMWMWKQSLDQVAVEMLTVWVPLHADTKNSRRAEWADAELWLQLPFPLTGVVNVGISWRCCGAVRTQHHSGCLSPNIFITKACTATQSTPALIIWCCPEQCFFASLHTNCSNLKYDVCCTDRIKIVLIGKWPWLFWLFYALLYLVLLCLVIFSCVPQC
jgi:hypothetical protein